MRRRRSGDIVTPPHSPTVPEGHRNDFNPSLINHTFSRVLWITSEKFISDGVIEFHWVWTTRDGEVKDQFTGTKDQLPANWQKRLL